jgi:hypothetical protein
VEPYPPTGFTPRGKMMEPELCINPQILHEPSYAWSYAGSSTGSIWQGTDSVVASVSGSPSALPLVFTCLIIARWESL